MITITTERGSRVSVTTLPTLAQLQPKKNPNRYLIEGAKKITRTKEQKQFDHFNFTD